MKFITRFFQQFFPRYEPIVYAEELSEITPIHIRDEVLERTDLYLRDYRYKTAIFYTDQDLNKSQESDASESSPIPRHPRPFSS